MSSACGLLAEQTLVYAKANLGQAKHEKLQQIFVLKRQSNCRKVQWQQHKKCKKRGDKNTKK